MTEGPLIVSPFNETGPRFVTGTLYSTTRELSRDGDSTHHADGDNGNRLQRPLSKPPLRPSEGLQVACAGKACPPQWRIRVTEPVSTSGWRVDKHGAPYGKHRHEESGNDGKRRSR